MGPVEMYIILLFVFLAVLGYFGIKAAQKHVEKHKGKPQSKLDYKMMALVFAIRDKFKKPIEILNKLDIEANNKVLDYGCGPGNYSIAATELVGKLGKIFAIDLNPLAIKTTRKKALKKRINNLYPIQTDYCIERWCAGCCRLWYYQNYGKRQSGQMV